MPVKLLFMLVTIRGFPPVPQTVTPPLPDKIPLTVNVLLFAWNRMPSAAPKLRLTRWPLTAEALMFPPISTPPLPTVMVWSTTSPLVNAPVVFSAQMLKSLVMLAAAVMTTSVPLPPPAGRATYGEKLENPPTKPAVMFVL